VEPASRHGNRVGFFELPRGSGVPWQDLTQLKGCPRLRDDAIKVIPLALVGIFARSAGVALDSFLVS
jgi:hypothetical protein